MSFKTAHIQPRFSPYSRHLRSRGGDLSEFQGGSRSSQAHSHDFVHEGANLARVQGTPYQKRKTPRIWPTIFWFGPISFFSCFYYKILFYFSSGGGMAPVPLPPAYVPGSSQPFFSIWLPIIHRRFSPVHLEPNLTKCRKLSDPML